MMSDECAEVSQMSRGSRHSQMDLGRMHVHAHAACAAEELPLREPQTEDTKISIIDRERETQLET